MEKSLPAKIPVFFDIDNTLIKGQTQQILVRYLLKKRKVKIHFFLKILLWFLLYKLDLVKDVFTIRKKTFENFAGWKVTEFETLAEECFEKEIRPRIFREALKLIQLHKRENHEIILTSASLSNIIEVLREDLGITFTLSTRLAVEKGKFTGKILGLVAYGENKVKMAKELVRTNKMDLEGSYAYTDHISDLPLLELVDNPVVVNPDRKLRKIAVKNNWQIYSFKQPRGALNELF